MTDPTPEPLTMARARELLVQAMQTQGPEFVYNPQGPGDPDKEVSYTCFNAPVTEAESLPLEEDDPRTKTGCLVGTALTLAGFKHHLTPENISSNIISLRFNDETGAEYFPRDVEAYLIDAQVIQDCGDTWGKAVAYAEERAVARGDIKKGDTA